MYLILSNFLYISYGFTLTVESSLWCYDFLLQVSYKRFFFASTLYKTPVRKAFSYTFEKHSCRCGLSDVYFLGL